MVKHLNVYHLGAVGGGGGGGRTRPVTGTG